MRRAARRRDAEAFDGQRASTMTPAGQDAVGVRPATAADAAAIARIYNHYVTDTIVTFEEEPVTAAEMAARIEQVVADSLPWLVADADGVVVGYAYATRWRPRF